MRTAKGRGAMGLPRGEGEAACRRPARRRTAPRELRPPLPERPLGRPCRRAPSAGPAGAPPFSRLTAPYTAVRPTRRRRRENLPDMSHLAMSSAQPLLAALADEPTGAAGEGYPIAGATAALVAALAASLTAAAADCSRSAWEGAAGARAQARALSRRAARLAEASAETYALAWQAAREPGPALGQTVARAAQAPLEVVQSATDIAQLAATVAWRAAGEVQADAVAAAELATGAAAAAGRLVQVNLVVGGDPAVAARVRGELGAAMEAARRARSAIS
jgi:formiminotetrahydrofolate cyclodeaminase